MMAASQAAAAIDIQKDNYIPIFSNRPADYREYRARVLLYKSKMKLLKKPKEAVINLLTSLTGAAWKLVERQADQLIESDTGFDDVIAILDQSFKYNDQVECPKAIDKFFCQLTRRPEQTMMSFVTDFRDARQEIEKHGIKLPEEVRAYILLKRAGLTAEQKQMVLTQVGNAKMTESAVEEALYYLLGQDYRGRVQYDHQRSKGKSRSNQWQRRQTAYAAADDEYDDGSYYDTAEPYGDEADDMQYDEAFEEHEITEYEDFPEYEDGLIADDSYQEYADLPESFDPETEEAFATYLDARRRFAEIKASRPIVDSGLWLPSTLLSNPPVPQPPVSDPSHPKAAKRARARAKAKESASPHHHRKEMQNLVAVQPLAETLAA